MSASLTDGNFSFYIVWMWVTKSVLLITANSHHSYNNVIFFMGINDFVVSTLNTELSKGVIFHSN